MRIQRVLEGLFVASGFAALVYEVVWARRISLSLGADARGVAAVLAGFMGGFALGGALAARPASRALRPFRVYAAVEGTMALLGYASPFLLGLLGPLGARIHPLSDQSPFFYDALRFAASVLVLLVPATLLGATFPLMSRLRVREESEVGEGLARIYAANTVGAAAGAAGTAFLLVPVLGLTGSVHLAAGINATIAVVSLLLDRSAPPAEIRPRPASISPRRSPLLAAVFLSGFASLALETLLTRALVGTLGASIYAFAAVLTAFLLGIGLGPWILPSAGDRAAGAERFALYQLAAVGGLLAGLFVLTRVIGIEGLLGTGRNRVPSLSGAGFLSVYQFVLCAVALLPAALFLGAAFPSAIRGLSLGAEDAPRAAGAAYAWNTLGAICGTLLAAFVGFPFLGLRASLALAAAASVAAAFAALSPRSPARARARRRGALLAAGLVPAAALVLFPKPRDPSNIRTLFVEEGASASVAVEESTGPGGETFRSLRVEGKVVATSAFLDRRLQRLLGHLAALAHPAPKRVLTVGLGTGMTAGAVSSHPEVEAATIVEIAPPVVDGARLFSAENHDVLDRARVRLEDGRSFLLGSREHFDVVTTDPIHPWTAGSGNLYTVEYFELARSRLAPGGVVGQWIPLYQISTEDVRSIAATFADVFPHTALFLTAYDFALLGSERPLEFDAADLERRLQHPSVRESLRDVAVEGAVDLLSTFVAGDEAVRAFARGGRINRDDRPFVEYSAPRSYLVRYALEALGWVRDRGARASEVPVRNAGPSLLEKIDEALRARDEALGGFIDLSPTDFPEAAARYARALKRR